MIERARMRITVPGVVAAIAYGAATVLWLGFTGPSGKAAAPIPIYLFGVTVAAALIPGLANQVTWTRAWLAGPAYYYGLHPGLFDWLVVTVAAGAATDVLDGFVARRLRQESPFGGGLDPVVDGLFYGAAATGLAASGLVPPWLAVVVVLRYALPAVAGALLVAGGRRPELRHTVFGQAATTIIGVTLGGAALLRALGRDPQLLVAVGSILIPLAALLTFGNLALARARAA